VTQASTIIADALGMIGVTDPTDSVPAEDAALGLRVLNRRINTMGLEPSLGLVVAFQAVPLIGGDSSKTIGTGADVNVECPVRIETGAFVRVDGTDHPLEVATRERWVDISIKSEAGIPCAVYFERTSSSQGRVTFWPTAQAACTVYLPLVQRTSQFAALGTDVTLSDGYEEMLTTDLAVALAPFYNREAPGSVIHRSRVTKRQIKRLNAQTPELSTDELQHAVHGGSAYPPGTFNV
jgi:hypothetical protein